MEFQIVASVGPQLVLIEGIHLQVKVPESR